ncbi:MAG: Gfo/Idh/MocA family oxidoreductase [Planctomycetaceae bacterium]|nr:Gfo/Idh/MocA family oxidoreductase [Planctomycetaceae bacterium]
MEPKDTISSVNRRQLLQTVGGVAGVAVLGTEVIAGTDPRPVRLGFIGVGSRGSALLRLMTQQPGTEIVAICDIEPDKVAQAKKVVKDAARPEPTGFADWNKLLEHLDVDAVVSALPVDLHAACYVDVLNAGKDLYAEKPLGLTVAECNDVQQAAERSGRIVQVGFQRRSDPRFTQPMKLVHAGEIGELLEGRVLWSNSWGPLTGWFGQRRRSGDWMVEQAVHNWDVLNWATQSLPKRAVGFGRNDLFREHQSDRDVHDYYSGVLEYENGVIVNIIHSWVPPTKFNEEHTRLIGTLGGIDFNSGTLSYRPNQNRPDRLAFDGPANLDNNVLAVESFLKSVRERSQPVATLAHARDALLACLLMREAVERGTAVTLKDIGA